MMSTTLNRSGYKRLIEEDLSWLTDQSRSLERDHIELVLRDSITRIYGDESKEKAMTTKPKATACKQPSSKHCPCCKEWAEVVARLQALLNIANEMRKPGD